MTTTDTPAMSLAGSPRRLRRERRVERLFRAAAITSVIISALIVVALVGKAWEFVSTVDLGSLWSIGWFPRRGFFDLKTVVSGTMLIALVAMVVATPLGLGAAIYLSEYANPRARRILKPSLEVLAGIPSVVLGFFALTWISPNVVQRFFEAGVFSMVSAGIGVGILVTPLVASVSEDAMRAVPMSLREASYGLGAKRAGKWGGSFFEGCACLIVEDGVDEVGASILQTGEQGHSCSVRADQGYGADV